MRSPIHQPRQKGMTNQASRAQLPILCSPNSGTGGNLTNSGKQDDRHWKRRLGERCFSNSTEKERAKGSSEELAVNAQCNPIKQPNRTAPPLHVQKSKPKEVVLDERVRLDCLNRR
ncbi:hypothetical protein AtNW77_MTg0322421 (mitochondrion) [Arabidopsis thaliana]|uniref:Uncharacterized protein n=2 Tax=Arabidopsis thaliana TaxID=3702 RepID=A0A654GF82_ARATH|nr:uncharacterized protein AT2G07621 [Arabidopsis thaliana]XP_020880462.1 uncharacterized protein LOC9313290 [Arabidopsis lyrata subsp. lyrata]ANM61966.1 hypothetical protein AT2G07621 [Arabidopsis thaliana]CAA0413893.1 unnamed protein product [Arabidopsis thaliana]VYS71781.1 unnamed protein product [Arabidopsis thaliana]|eukprot:NP_001324152.1 hypothetical protein AT2G07621 [Arabidopsis thaliana]